MSQFSAGSVRMREQTNESVDPLLHSTSLSLSLSLHKLLILTLSVCSAPHLPSPYSSPTLETGT